MANLADSPHFSKHDDYYTPKSAWEQIAPVIATVENVNGPVWEACMLGATQSQSPSYLREIIGDPELVVADTEMDMLTQQPEEFGSIITNPPFSTELKKQVLTRLHELDKPFIIIMNSMNLFTKYLREIFGDDMKHLQVITPDKKINYDKLDNGILTPTKNCSFYSIYLCYKLDLPQQMLWL